MTISLSGFLLPTLTRTLDRLDHLLDKGEAYAAEKSIDAEVLLGLRLYPDMLPLSSQFIIASDVAQRGSARLAGLEPEACPSPTDRNFAVLRAYVANAKSLVEGRDAAAIDASAATELTVPVGRDRTATLTGEAFARMFMLPNVYFHAATAYALLRQAGVSLGKMDFLGDV